MNPASIENAPSNRSRPVRDRGALTDRAAPRVLILTAPIGWGHVSVAHALKRALHAEEIRATVRSPILRTKGFCRLPRLYAYLTIRAPRVWATYYRLRELPLIRAVHGRVIRRRLAPALRALEPWRFDSIVVTSSMYCHCLPELKVAAETTVVVTDLFDGPSAWFTPGADRYLVPTRAMLDAGLRAGVSADALVMRRMATVASDRRRRTEWKVRDKLRILIVAGSEGCGPLASVARGTVTADRRVFVTVGCGRNRRLKAEIDAWRMPNVVSSAFRRSLANLDEFDLVITKPGSVTLMEAIDVGCPFLLLPGIPGIEDGNNRWLAGMARIPVLRDVRSARLTIGGLVNEDLTLTAQGMEWWERVVSIEEVLPDRRQRIKGRDLTSL